MTHRGIRGLGLHEEKSMEDLHLIHRVPLSLYLHTQCVWYVCVCVCVCMLCTILNTIDNWCADMTSNHRFV